MILAEAKAKLEELRREGLFDSDIDGAYWQVEQAQAGRSSVAVAVEYATDVLTRYGRVKPVAVPVIVAKTISKAEHDALAGDLMPSRSLSKEDYERMMREAQGE